LTVCGIAELQEGMAARGEKRRSGRSKNKSEKWLAKVLEKVLQLAPKSAETFSTFKVSTAFFKCYCST